MFAAQAAVAAAARWRWPMPRRWPAPCPRRARPAQRRARRSRRSPPPCPRPARPSTSAASKARCANSSIKKVGEVVDSPSRRSAGDHPHLAASTGIIMAKAAKAAVKEDIRSLSGAERAAIIMLSLGEDHSEQDLADDGRGGDQGNLPGHVQPGHGLLQRDREAAGRFRLGRCRAPAR